MNRSQQDIYWMQRALEQAKRAAQIDEVPVGAVLIDRDQQLIASAHNSPISRHDPTAHAEVNVLRKAAEIGQNYRLIDTTLYVTLEPCVMCVGALIHARVKRLVYGALEHKTGAVVSCTRLLDDVVFNHQLEVQGGVLAKPCADVLSAFFARRRKQKKLKDSAKPQSSH